MTSAPPKQSSKSNDEKNITSSLKFFYILNKIIFWLSVPFDVITLFKTFYLNSGLVTSSILFVMFK